MEYAGYAIDGSKANKFRAAAMALFGDANLKRQIAERMTNLDRETMSFTLDVRGDCPAEILDLGQRFGQPVNSYD